MCRKNFLILAGEELIPEGGRYDAGLDELDARRALGGISGCRSFLDIFSVSQPATSNSLYSG